MYMKSAPHIVEALAQLGECNMPPFNVKAECE
jgi:hypothetical protein